MQNGVAFFSVDSKSDIPLSQQNKHRHSCVSCEKLAEGPHTQAVVFIASELPPELVLLTASSSPISSSCLMDALYGRRFGWMALTGRIPGRLTSSRASMNGYRMLFCRNFSVVQLNYGPRNQVTLHAGPDSGCLIDPHPPTVGGAKSFLGDLLRPHCGSSNTDMRSMFGSTLCRSIHYCKDCKQGFERFKPL